MNSTVTIPSPAGSTATSHHAAGRRHPSVPRRIPLTRIVGVELRKSFDTRAGFWLLASIGVASLLTTATIISFGPGEELTYSMVTLAIAFPMSVILPMIAVLSVTAEWTQRSGLTTFTLVPHRSRVVLAKAIAVTLVAPVAAVIAFAVGALGNVVGAEIANVPSTWDQGAPDLLYTTLANALLVLVGVTLGVLIRNSPGALVGYFIYGFVAPGLLTLLAMSQEWFRDLRPWVDPTYTQDALLQGSFTCEQWTQLAANTGVWLVVPLALGLVLVTRAEVK